MNINQLILRNLKKNLKNYYLYVFALVFSSALYFAFVTLQYDPALDDTTGTIKGGAGLRAASVLLIAIVSIFLLYANTIFIKRRSKEIGLFQLIGMPKKRIFRILSVENFILYACSLLIGIFIGFSFSKVMIMILFKITNINAIATLHFSVKAFTQTLIVFGVIYLFIMIMNYAFIKSQTILSLFKVSSVTENKNKRISVVEILIGVLGIVFIAFGYYISSRLFSGSFGTMNEITLAMLMILASVIIGTYFFYKGSVRFLLNIARKSKNGYLNINEVLSLSSIMFKMKSNSFMLTVITTISALAIGFLCLSYISYYSIGALARESVPDDFTISSSENANLFKTTLENENIPYTEKRTAVIFMKVNMENIIKSGINSSSTMTLPVVSEKDVEGVKLSEKETLLTGYNDALKGIMSFKNSGYVKIKGKHTVISQRFIGIDRKFVISTAFTKSSLPSVIVDDKIFRQLKKDIDPSIQNDSSIYIGVSLQDEDDSIKANKIFKRTEFDNNGVNLSRMEMVASQKQMMGIIMFVVGFLGLTFLITSGCILYFKQMDESENEKSNYTILKKLGFTDKDLIKGIRIKQIFNFGIPLVIGLSHSYFAVKSGWFYFGKELWTPMIIVMILYTILYSIFGILSVLYYKKVIKQAL